MNVGETTNMNMNEILRVISVKCTLEKHLLILSLQTLVIAWIQNAPSWLRIVLNGKSEL
jgi:hypothetical protein